MQAKFTRRFSKGWSAQVNYTLQSATNYDDEWSMYDPDLNKGPAGFDRTHNFTTALMYQLPFGKDKPYGTNWGGVTEALLGGWQLNSNIFVLSGTPFNVTYRDAGQDRDTGSGDLNARPNLIGNTDGPQTQDEWFNAAPIGSSGSAFGRPARGTFGDLGRNQLRGPGFWQADLSLFKSFWTGGAASVSASRPRTSSTTSTSPIPTAKSAYRATTTRMPDASRTRPATTRRATSSSASATSSRRV